MPQTCIPDVQPKPAAKPKPAKPTPVSKAVKAFREDHPLYQPFKDYKTMDGVVDLTHLAPSSVFGILPADDWNNSIDVAIDNAKPFLPYIRDIKLEEDEYMTTKLEITFDNPDFIISDHIYMQPGTLIDIQFGYGKNTAYLGRRFQLVQSYPDFPEDGIPTVKIVGYDGRHHLTLGEKVPVRRTVPRAKNRIKGVQTSFREKKASLTPRTGKKRKGKHGAPKIFNSITDYQIINNIAFHFGFCLDADVTTTKRTVAKDASISYWEFIVKLAKRNNFDTWVDWDDSFMSWCLHWRKKEDKFVSGYEFQWGEDGNGTLLSCQPTEDLLGQITDLEIVSFDKRLRKTTWNAVSETSTFNANRSSFKKNTKIEPYGAKVKFTIGGRTIEVYNDSPFRSAQDAKDFARQHIMDRQADYLVVSGTVVGTENLRPRQVHKLSGIGRFSGTYKFTQVRHIISNSAPYRTEFVAYRIPEKLGDWDKTLNDVYDVDQFNDDQKKSGGDVFA